MGSWRPVVRAGLLLAGLAGCKREADLHGTVSQAGKGVPGSSVSLSCPDGSKRLTTTNSTGDFRFEELGPGVDDACIVEVLAPGTWIAPLSVGTRCAQHDAASRLCTEALFAFAVR
jgi:hypothetical protein